jgi:hypothetical protein
MCTGGSFAGVKWQKREADYSSPTNAKVKNGGPTPPVLYISSWGGVRLIKHRENFTLTTESHKFRNTGFISNITAPVACYVIWSTDSKIND